MVKIIWPSCFVGRASYSGFFSQSMVCVFFRLFKSTGWRSLLLSTDSLLHEFSGLPPKAFLTWPSFFRAHSVISQSEEQLVRDFFPPGDFSSGLEEAADEFLRIMCQKSELAMGILISYLRLSRPSAVSCAEASSEIGVTSKLQLIKYRLEKNRALETSRRKSHEFERTKHNCSKVAC